MVEISEERYVELMTTERKYDMLFGEWLWLGNWLNTVEKQLEDYCGDKPERLDVLEQTFKHLRWELGFKNNSLSKRANEIDREFKNQLTTK